MKVVVDNITNVENSSGVPTINENITKLANEFNKVLYRDGSQTVNGSLDMNSNRIINLPDAVYASEAVPLKQIAEYYARVQAAQEIAIAAANNKIYASVSAGEADNTTGAAFLVDNGDETVSWYRRTLLGSELIWTPLSEKNFDILMQKASVSVVDFGAIGDGTGDQTQAFRDAVNYVSAIFGGGSVLVPQGTYRLTGNVTIPSNVRVWGHGPESIIKSANLTGVGVFDARGTLENPVEGVVISDLSIVGEAVFTDGLPNINNGDAIDFQFVSHCVFQNLVIDGWNANGIAIANGSFNLATNNRINATGQGLALYCNAVNGEGNLLLGNIVRNTGRYNAIHLEGSAGDGLGEGKLYNTVVAGNVVADSYGLAYNIELAPNSTVTGNTALRSGPGEHPSLNNGFLLFGSPCSSVTANTSMNNDGYGFVIGAGCSATVVGLNTTAGNILGSLLLTDSGVQVSYDVEMGLNAFTEGPMQRSGNVSIAYTKPEGVQFRNQPIDNAVVLDYYQEGTFTPVAQGATSAGAGTYTFQVGQFTRIGNLVHFCLQVGYSAHTGTGDLKIAGLPFASTTALNQPVSLWVNGMGISAGKHFQASIPQDATHINIQTYADVTGAAEGYAIPSVVPGILVQGSYLVKTGT